MMQDTGYKIQDARFRITDKKTILHRVSCILHRKSRASCIMHRDNKGITLIEMVLGMVLIAIIALVVANALSTGITGFFVVDYRKEALDQARIAMDRMAKEIRNTMSLGRSVDVDGFDDAEIGTANGTQFCFRSTNNLSDNNPANDTIIISFRYTGTVIVREDGLANLAACPGSGGNTLATNVTALNFRYILADGTTTSTPDPTDVRRIQIGWSGTPGVSVTVSNETISLSSEVWPRNL